METAEGFREGEVRYGIRKEEAERQADLWQTTAEVEKEKSFTQKP